MRFRVDTWDDRGSSIAETLALAANYDIAAAAYRAALLARPRSRITLRHGAHLICERIPTEPRES